MARALIVLPTSTYRASDFLDAADNLNVDVVIASDRRQALSATMGDRFLLVDPGRPSWSADRIVELAERLPLDAIIPADDRGVLIAAAAGRSLGLSHNPPEAVAATRDKAEMRARFAAAGVPQPRFAVAAPEDDLGAVAAGIGFPCVIKPPTLSASRGVIRVDDPHDALSAAATIRDIVATAGIERDTPLVVEQFVSGPEVAVEGLVSGGDLTVLALLDKPDPMEGPYFEETIFVTPSRHATSDQRRVSAMAAAAVTALGLREGPVHAEFRLAANGISTIEIAARSIGGLCGRALRFGLLGTSLETVLLRHALGFPAADLDPQSPASGVMMLPIPRAGTLRAVSGREPAAQIPGVTGIEVTVPIGHVVRPLPAGDRYLGFLFAQGPDPAAVEATLRSAFAELTIDID